MPRARKAKAADPLKLWPYPDWLKAVAKDERYEWARIAWRRSAAQPGAWFDHAKAELVIERWPEWFRLTEDRWAGKPFHLSTWQAIVVRLIVGWKIPVQVGDENTGRMVTRHVRLYRRLLLWIPRKNGKSEFLAALGLLLWAFDAVVSGQGFVFARKEDQALVIFNKMKAMISYSKELADGTQQFKKSIYLKEAVSTFFLLSGSEQGTHGKSPTVVLGDEMHEWRSRTIEDNLRQGMGARLQPFQAFASTAGVRAVKGVGYELWEESTQILEGTKDVPSTLVVIFAAPAEADPFDEKTWYLANPDLPRMPMLRMIQDEAREAAGNPRAEAKFKRYHLNQWVDDLVRWLPVKKWNACTKGDPCDWREYPRFLKERTGCATLDVSSTQDITCLLFTCGPSEDDPKFRVMARFWVPEETLEKRVREDRVPYDRWAAMKDCFGRPLLETTPGDYVDQNYVLQAAMELCQDYRVERGGFDPWNARKLYTDMLAEGMPEDIWIEMRQGIQTLGEGSRHLERLVFAGLYGHGGNPILKWMAQNVVVRRDANENFMPSKGHSAEKIDGIVCGVMGTTLLFADGEADPQSYLEEEDVLVV